MSKKKRLLSGVKSTGKLHVGNYFGAIKQFVDLQDEYDSHIMIADVHSLNSMHNWREDQEEGARESQERRILEVAMGYLAMGLDPKKVVLFKQSDVPAHTYLGWIFCAMTSMPYLMRAHSFKDAEAKSKELSVGTFIYPMLMAADILLYSPEIVPVGKDQKQHIEFARDKAEKFNRIYGEVFTMPKEHIIEDVQIVIGLDGQKMSKSYGNTIPLFATAEETGKLIMGIAMDSKGIEEEKNPEDYTLYKVARLFATDDENQQLRTMFEKGGVGYGEIKKMVAEIINTYLEPMRSKHTELVADPEYVKSVLRDGAEKANVIANAKLSEVQEKVGFKI